MMRCFATTLLLAFAAAAAATEAATTNPSAKHPSTHLMDPKALTAARSQLASPALAASYKELRKQAAAALADSTLWSVTTKNLTIPSISSHNYLSIGIYNHPCNALPHGCKAYPGGHLLPPSQCDNASGLPWEPCDGIRNQGAIDDGDAPSQSSMVNSVVTLGAAAFYTANASESALLVARAREVVDAWFLNAKTAMLPNLFYGQIIPTKTPPQKSHGGFIEWAHTAYLLDSLELLRFADERDGGGGGWSADFDAKLRAWWKEFEGYVESMPAQGERRMTNNHASWYDVDWQSVALYAGNRSAAAEAAAEVLTQRISKQILPNGTEWIELERAEPSGYCQYNLKALTEDAVLARSGGAVDVWGFESEDGRSLRKAIEWLLPYATNRSAWPYPQNLGKAPDWETMFAVLRRASVAYKSRKYELAACETMRALGKLKDYRNSQLNLQVPAAFEIETKSGVCKPKAEREQALGRQLFKLTTFSAAEHPLAVCMDGSSGGVYVAPATTQPTYFVLYLEGGGWCWDEKTCAGRCGNGCAGPGSSAACQNCTGIGSSKKWGPTQNLTGVFSSSPAQSPLSGAHKFYLRYCTSDAHMGSRGASAGSLGWHFRGQHTIAAALDLMVKQHGLGSAPGHTVLFGGGSAGGRGAMSNLDYIAPQLEALGAKGVKVMGFPDSAYWIDHMPDRQASPPDTFAGFNVTTKQIYALANISGRAPADCQAAYPGEEWKCAFGQYRFPFIKTPYLMVASQNDLFQLGENVGHRPKTAQELGYSKTFADSTRAGMTSLAAPGKAPAGSAFYSMQCYSHSTSLSVLFYFTKINGVTMAQAMGRFLGLSSGGALAHISNCSGFNCGKGCIL